MNERIKELADQCWNNFDLFGVEIKTPDAFAEKFAELIVKECMDLCEQVAKDAHQQKDSSFLTADGKQLYNGVWGGAMNCIGRIRNNFGVE